MRHLRAMLASGSIATALLAASGIASAVIPTGSFEIEFGGRQSIWMGEEGVDSGEEFCTDFGTAFDTLEFCDFQAFLDGKGKIYGFLEFSGWSGGLHFAEGGPIKGIQKGDDRTGITRFSFTIKLTGVASDGFATMTSKSSIRLTGQTTADGLVSGLWEQSVCVQGFGCNESQSPVPRTIWSNGGWSLELAITDEGGGALGGSARVEFGDGNECFYAVSGKYNAKKDTAGLSLDPTEFDCAGTSLRLKDVRLATSAPDVISGSIAYSLFGFKGATNLYDGLPGSSLQEALENHYANHPPSLFAFICNGTVVIAASVDPATCAWTVFGSAPAQSGGSATITAISQPGVTIVALPPPP